MFFTIKKELGFSRSEWNQLSWVDKQMYTEQLAMYLYEKAYNNWKQQPAGKRGPEPRKPDFQRAKAEAMPQSNDIDPDIGSLEGMDIETV